MADLNSLHSRVPGHLLAFFGDAPVLFHCHHFNLFLDQTIDDALGKEGGTQLRTEAAHDAAGQLLASLCAGVGCATPAERLALAQAVFSAMGHGKLDIAAAADGGHAHGEHLHYGFSWSQKYGKDVRRRHPADGFAAGFAAAATEVAFELAPGSLLATENDCVALRDTACGFALTPGERSPGQLVAKAEAEPVLRPVQLGLEEPAISTITNGLLDFLSGVGPDSRGLVEAFGVYVTLHLANYYNAISYGALARLDEKNPALRGVLESLLRESGQVCAFHTFGGILLSPEWEGMVGAPDGDVEKHVVGCCAISRALGFGQWSIQELDPDKRLVLRTPLTYEAPYAMLEGPVDAPSSLFLQGAGSALMELAHRVPWTEHPSLSDSFYRKTFSRGAQWKSTQTHDRAMGDEYCEVVVERA